MLLLVIDICFNDDDDQFMIMSALARPAPAPSFGRLSAIVSVLLRRGRLLHRALFLTP